MVVTCQIVAVQCVHIRHDRSDDQIKTGQECWTNEQAEPEDHIPQNVSTFQELCAAEHDQWHLQELSCEEVAAHLLEEDEHQKLVHKGREEEGDECRGSLAEMKC